MMKKLFITLLVLVTFGTTWAQNPQSYVIYDKDGKEANYSDMLKYMSQKEVVFLGEIHDCPITHWMEYLIIRDLHNILGDQLMLGAEMFERDDQLLMDEYMSGLIPFSRLEVEAKLWSNYKNDYAPIVEYAKANSLRFIATNVARRYANMVSKSGFESLEKVSEEGRKYIAPLPIDYHPNPLVDAFFKESLPPMMKNAPTDKLSKAQAVKDATMAWSIAQTLKGCMVHLNGSYHSTGHAGILTYLNGYRPGVQMGTIEFIRQENIGVLNEKYKGRADYFICVPETMIHTHR